MAEQRYVIDESVQHGYVGSRDAPTFLPFLVPHLRSGLDVLDAAALRDWGRRPDAFMSWLYCGALGWVR
jgi:hypothetical protein